MDPNALKNLVEISHFYGSNPEYILAGGGNTSFKDKENIWIKASGTCLGTIEADDFVCLSRQKLSVLKEKSYSMDKWEREAQVQDDLFRAVISPAQLKPSVETSLHEIIDFAYIVHTHALFANAMLCSKKAKEYTREIFGDEVLFIEYQDPGYALFRSVLDKLKHFREERGFTPAVLFLQNHGVFVGGDSISEIRTIYQSIETKLKDRITIELPDPSVRSFTSGTVSVISDYLSGKGLMVKGYRGDLVDAFIHDKETSQEILSPFSPDGFVYCKSNYLLIEKETDASGIKQKIDSFIKQFAYFPRIIILEGECLVIVEDTEESMMTVLQVYLNAMKICLLSEDFGGASCIPSDGTQSVYKADNKNHLSSFS